MTPIGQSSDHLSLDGPAGLVRSLDENDRFHRDTGAGRIFHPLEESFRENVSRNSLHILVDGNRVTAHVDLVSPLGVRPGASSRYAVGQVAAHNLSGAAADFVRLLRGRQGDHRCELDCEWFDDGDTRSRRALPADAGPGSLQLEARVGGRLDEARLATTVASVLSVHREALRVVECPDADALARARSEFQNMAVPLEERPPLRVLLAHHPDGDFLMMNVNHAACDGFGAVRILHTLARAYAGGGQPFRVLDFLALRDLPVGPASRGTPLAVRWSLALVERLRNRLAPPARIMPDEAAADPGYGFHHVSVPLRGASADDIAPRAIEGDDLLAGLHRAIGEWNLAHGAPGHRISVLVPADLRPPGWPDEAVGNLSVTARVSTSRRHRQSFRAAHRQVSAQTTRNNRSRTGIALISALDRTGLLPLWTKQSLIVLYPLTRNRFVDTAVLCDLGRFTDPPSFGPESGEAHEIWFSAPARVPVPLSIGAVTVSGRLHLSFRYSHRLFSPDAARRFAECYLAELIPVPPVHPAPGR